jgi:DNA invertase Pin-like site-specific DNA recombinase
MKTTIPAVGYWRMSSSQQEKSIPQQKEVMAPKCKLHDVAIVRDFEDRAKSGGKVKGRDSFLEMLAFCQERYKAGNPIECIVCYDTSRFSRANPIQTGRYLCEFMEAGVCKLFTAERWFNLNRPEDRTIFSLQGEFTDHRYLHDHAARVARGKRGNAQAAYFNGGPAPYGFDRLVIDGDGNECGRYGRDQALSRAKGQKVVLVPTADQQELETVRWLFQTFAISDVSCMFLGSELNRKGIPGPGRKPKTGEPSKWGRAAVRGILTNPLAVGDYRYGYAATGAYRRIVDGEIREVAMNEKRIRNHKPVLVKDAHEGIVDRQTWDIVQKKLAARRTPKRLARHKGYVLSGGLLVCGHCGARMNGSTSRSFSKYTYRRYTCQTAWTKGREVCAYHSIREDKILPALVRKLLEIYLNPKRLEQLREEIRSTVEARHERNPEAVERMKSRLAEIDADIRTGTRNVLRSTDNLDLLQEALGELRAKREQLAKELERAERSQQIPVEEKEAEVNRAIERLFQLRSLLERCKPEQLREVLRLLVCRVDIYFDTAERTHRKRFRFAKGVVKLRPVLELAGNGRNDGALNAD